MKQSKHSLTNTFDGNSNCGRQTWVLRKMDASTAAVNLTYHPLSEDSICFHLKGDLLTR